MQLLEKKRRKVIINITSLIDVLFLLLIFFMVSSTFVEQPGMKLELPESESSTMERIKELVLEINQDGSIFLNESPIQLDSLENKFKKLLPALESPSLILKADKSVPHGTVVKVMDKAKISGLEKLIIATKTGK
ncbi:biopolymer transporter ExbD [candidate division KSB1 bacterium]|nr:biopolymer transporter ExbD [candidate division KSB1 bacterium]MBL7094651.1 biopolymer transporter ExbD [candidate division KSB1 bacterium]